MDRRKDGRTDGQTLFHRTFPAEVGGPTRRKKNRCLRIESIIKAIRKDVSIIEIWETEMLRKKSHKTRLDHLHQVKRKEYKREAEELKQRIKAKAVILRR